MAASKKEPKNLQKIEESQSEQAKLLEECQEHESDSYSWLSTVRDSWDDKEAMLLGKSEDQLGKIAKSKVYDSTLSTMNLERGSRVMAQEPSGRAYADSKKNLGKNMLMNMLLKHYAKNANEDYSFLLKLRFLDIYSGAYGSMFGLVPWRVNPNNGYVGPELNIIGMRDVRPQPGKKNIDSSDQFGVRSVVTPDWLNGRDPKVWNMAEIERLLNDLKLRKAKGDSSKTNNQQNKSYIERQRYPNQRGDAVFPDIELFTEYRREMWITWSPQMVDVKTSKPYILRVVKSPYVRGLLPIVVKHSFPLLDSLIGLGDFEKGKTLQYAVNSLISLYFDGVKYAIFPPLHININEVVPNSIKWGAGEKWYMNHPNSDVQIMNMQSTQWLNTFQSTYGFLMSSMQNLAGSTLAAQPQGTELNLGKTPEALRQNQQRESARDEWDRFMMEDTINQIYERWMALTTEKLDLSIPLRVFGSEIKDLQTMFPNEKDLLTVFDSKDQGKLFVNKGYLNDKGKGADKGPTQYYFDLDSGSTMKRSLVDEGEAASSVLQDFVQAPALLQEIKAEGGNISITELYKRRLIGSGVKDWDKIIKMPEANVGPEGSVNIAANAAGNQDQLGQPTVPAQGMPAEVPQTTPAEVQPTAPAQPTDQGAGNFNDQEIAAAAMQVLGGMQGIPAAA